MFHRVPGPASTRRVRSPDRIRVPGGDLSFWGTEVPDPRMVTIIENSLEGKQY
jgi:hypothetical protein